MIRCIGDSHIFIFEGREPFRIHRSMKRITATHIKNSLSEIDEMIIYIPLTDYLLFSAGEVDIRVFFSNRFKDYQENKNQIIHNVVDNYFKTIFVRYGKFPLIFYGPPPSYIDRNKIINRLQMEHDINLPFDDKFYAPNVYNNIERNQITKIFNERLEYLCRINNVRFFTMFYDLINPDLSTNFKMFGGDDGCHISIDNQDIVIRNFINKINL